LWIQTRVKCGAVGRKLSERGCCWDEDGNEPKSHLRATCVSQPKSQRDDEPKIKFKKKILELLL